MTATQEKMSFLNKEIDEYYTHLSRQHSQSRWFVQLYLLSLAGLFALLQFIADQPPRFAGNVVGIAAGILVFAFGWLLLSVIAHKMGMMIMTHRQISALRGHRLALTNSAFKSDYLFPSGPKVVGFAKLVKTTPVIFFALNYMVLCGSVGFFFARLHDDWVSGLAFALLVGALFGVYYPRSCVTFYKHINSAELAKTLEQRSELEDGFEARRHRIAKQGGWAYSLLLTSAAGGAVILAAVFVATLVARQVFQDWHLLLAGVAGACAFGFARFHLEKHKGLGFARPGND